MVAGAAVGTAQLIHHQSARSGKLTVDDVVLTAEPIEVELSDDARTLIGNLGYDPTYGARPLKRVIQKRLVDALALAILEGRFVAGDTVKVDTEREPASGELVLERATAAAPMTV